jgi:hypothetical protein
VAQRFCLKVSVVGCKFDSKIEIVLSQCQAKACKSTQGEAFTNTPKHRQVEVLTRFAKVAKREPPYVT